MAIINRVSTSNTFQQHVSTTDETVTTLNALTEGTGGTFTLSSDIKVWADPGSTLDALCSKKKNKPI